MGAHKNKAVDAAQDSASLYEVGELGSRGKKILEQQRRLYLKTRDMKHVLEALKWCAYFGIVMPDWAATAFCAALLKVEYKHVGSWDDVFGRPLKKRKRLAAARRRFQLEPQVYFAITGILEDEPGTKKDNALFERVGGELGIGTGDVIKIWADNRFRRLDD